jgi:hypothetical protein
MPQRRGPTGSKNEEERKISPEIFEADVEEPDGSSPDSSLKRLVAPKSVHGIVK